MVEYECSRLCFNADMIEPLDEHDSFVVHTSEGIFQFAKSDFYRVFSNVVQSKSYQEGRQYNYRHLPKRAMQFLILGQSAGAVRIHPPKSTPPKDLVGEEIRAKIKEIGVLWRNSANNPHVDSEVLRSWGDLIEEWIKDETMPLIVRKDTSKRGQSFIHPCGREIIVSDNTVAIWVYSNVLKGRVFTLPQIKELLRRNELPMIFISTKVIKEKAKYSKPLGLSSSLPNWKVCHIEPVGFNTHTCIKDLEISKIEEHFRRYANPGNMFVLPKEIGYLGEIEVFIEEQKR